MKVLIDIPDEKYDRIMDQIKLDRNFRECKITEFHKVTKGDVETTLFPNEYWQCTSDETGEQLMTDGNNHFNLNWWNSSYEEKE